MSVIDMSAELHARAYELLSDVESDIDEHHHDGDVEDDALQQDQVLPSIACMAASLSRARRTPFRPPPITGARG
jgi:hypothetical protein